MAPNIAPFVVTDYTVTRDKYIAEQPLYANYDIDEATAVIKLSVPSLLRCSLLCSSHQECVSFDYSEISGICSCSRFQNPVLSSAISSPGFKFFTFLDGESLIVK